MKKKLLLKSLALGLLTLSTTVANGQGISDYFTSDLGNWSPKHGTLSDYSLTDGNLDVTMIIQGNDKYRNDFGYNVSGDVDKKATLNPSTDVYLAVKFIGDRPAGAMKLEMKQYNTDGSTTWHNSEWSGGTPDGSLVTNAGNSIYYFNLSKDADYTGTSMDILQINFIIADADAEPYSYSIDWIQTFESEYALKVAANMDDDAPNETVEEELYKTFSEDDGAGYWTSESGSSSDVASGHLNVTMADQGSSYRGDIWFNYSNNSSNVVGLNPSDDVYLAIKFIGDRPDGALKFEMQYENTDGSLGWFNSQWNGGSADGSVTTSGANTIYYFNLSKDGGYTGSADIVLRKLHFVIADAKAEPYSYAVDWIKTFKTVADIESDKDMKDDGSADSDEVTTSIIRKGESDVNIYSGNGTVKMNNCTPGNRVSVYGMTGSLVYSEIINSTSTSIPCKPGMYIIKVSGDNVHTQKVLVK